MNYKISFPERYKHLLEIELLLEQVEGENVILQLPAWRPGRYELANYGKNIYQVTCKTIDGIPIQCEKVAKESWRIDSSGKTSLIVSYKYYAAQMDAGGSWVDRDLIYLNFINCLLYDPSGIMDKCKVELEIPTDYKVACGLPVVLGNLYADNFHRLVDSPLIASPELKHDLYTIAGSEFHIWFQGNVEPEFQKIKKDFYAFTTEQIDTVGEFPEKDYHFLFHILPYRFHHGVEHSNSTVITVGPAEKFYDPSYYHNLLSVSSHELFHAWNICKIRPTQMLPYDFTKENFFRTGFVAEGFTTYYGDLFLVRSGVFNLNEFFEEINLTFKRHFENWGRKNYSLADSSFDLWTDGYVSGIPNRKVSIYVKGSIVALMLDLTIISFTNGQKSLDDVIRVLWNEFGKKGVGYTENDIQVICSKICGSHITAFFQDFIRGTSPEEGTLSKLLEEVACELVITNSEVPQESIYGFRTIEKGGRNIVDLIEPGSPSDKVMAIDDVIVSVNGCIVKNNLQELIIQNKDLLVLEVEGLYGTSKVELIATDKNYFYEYRIQKQKQPSERQKGLFKKWLRQDW